MRFIYGAVRSRDIFHKFDIAPFGAESPGQVDGLLFRCFCVYDQVAVYGVCRDLLPGKGAHQFIHNDRKSDGRRALPEFLQEMIIASAPDDGVAGPVCIGAENDPSIITVVPAHAQVKCNMVFRSVKLQQAENVLKTLHAQAGILIRRAVEGLVEDLRPADQFRKNMESLADRLFHVSAVQKLLYSEVIAVRDQGADLPAFFFVKVGGSHKAADIIRVADADLEFSQPGFLKPVHDHGDHLGVGFDRIKPDQLRAELGVFFQTALIAGMVDKGVPCITETDREILLLKQGCRGPRDRRGDIRPEGQDIAVPVEELVKLLGGGGTDLLAEYIIIFECRRLYVLIAVQMEYGAQVFLKCKFGFAFSVVDITDSFRSMKFLFHMLSSFTLMC